MTTDILFLLALWAAIIGLAVILEYRLIDRALVRLGELPASRFLRNLF